MTKTEQIAKLIVDELMRRQVEFDYDEHLAAVRVVVRISRKTSVPFAIDLSKQSSRRVPIPPYIRGKSRTANGQARSLVSDP